MILGLIFYQNVLHSTKSKIFLQIFFRNFSKTFCVNVSKAVCKHQMIFKTLQRSRSRYSVLGYNIEKTRSVNNLSNSNSNSPAGSGFLPLSHTLSFSYFALFLPKAQDCRASTFQALSDKHMLVTDLALSVRKISFALPKLGLLQQKVELHVPQPFHRDNVRDEH